MISPLVYNLNSFESVKFSLLHNGDQICRDRPAQLGMNIGRTVVIAYHAGALEPCLDRDLGSNDMGVWVVPLNCRLASENENTCLMNLADDRPVPNCES